MLASSRAKRFSGGDKDLSLSPLLLEVKLRRHLKSGAVDNVVGRVCASLDLGDNFRQQSGESEAWDGVGVGRFRGVHSFDGERASGVGAG